MRLRIVEILCVCLLYPLYSGSIKKDSLDLKEIDYRQNLPAANIEQWYHNPSYTVEYRGAAIDLNADGTPEWIIRRDKRLGKKSAGSPRFYVMKKGLADRSWDFLASDIKARKVSALPTWTKGWRDLSFDGKLFCHADSRGYRACEHPGKPMKPVIPKPQRMLEHFGLRFPVDSGWKTLRRKEIFSRTEPGYVIARGVLPGASKPVLLNIEASAHSDPVTFLRIHGVVPHSVAELGGGKIQGHPVRVFFFRYGPRGEKGAFVLRFDEPEYFADPKRPGEKLFARTLYVMLSGDLFERLPEGEVPVVLENYVTPFFNRMRIAPLNTFETPTGKKQGLLQLRYRRESVRDLSTSGGSPVSSASRSPARRIERAPSTERGASRGKRAETAPTLPAYLVPMGGRTLRWNMFVVRVPEGWYLNRKKTTEDRIVFQRTVHGKKIYGMLLRKSFRVSRRRRRAYLRAYVEAYREDKDYRQVHLRYRSNVPVLDDPHPAVLSALLWDNTIFFYLPYVHGRLYNIAVMIGDRSAKAPSTAMRNFLESISLQ